MAANGDEGQDNVWILETQTKGTGANMVPLDRVLKRSQPVPGFNIRKPERAAPEQPAARPAHRFKLTDVISRQVLAEDVDARGAVEALEGVRSIVDVIVYVWEPHAERWRVLSFGETRALWDHRRATARSRS